MVATTIALVLHCGQKDSSLSLTFSLSLLLSLFTSSCSVADSERNVACGSQEQELRVNACVRACRWVDRRTSGTQRSVVGGSLRLSDCVSKAKGESSQDSARAAGAR